MAGSPAIAELEKEIAAIESAQEPTRAKIAATQEEARAKVKALEAELVDGQGIIARNRAAIDLLNGKTPVAITGQRRAGRTRAPQASVEERGARIVEIVKGNMPEGSNGTEIAKLLGVSTGTASKVIDSLLGTGQLTTNGKERRARRLLIP